MNKTREEMIAITCEDCIREESDFSICLEGMAMYVDFLERSWETAKYQMRHDQGDTLFKRFTEAIKYLTPSAFALYLASQSVRRHRD